MRVPVEESLRRIARSIVEENRTVDEWAAIESDDMFQDERYVGGFDENEREFCFSYHGSEGEVWFQLSLEQVADIATGGNPDVEGRAAE